MLQGGLRAGGLDVINAAEFSKTVALTVLRKKTSDSRRRPPDQAGTESYPFGLRRSLVELRGLSYTASLEAKSIIATIGLWGQAPRKRKNRRFPA